MPVSAHVKEITDASFEGEVLRSDTPFLLDFSAVWCGPCKRLAPFVDEVAKEFEGKLKVGKLDIDENQETPTRFGVMSVPTLIFFKGGEEVKRHVGLCSKADLAGMVQDVLK